MFLLADMAADSVVKVAHTSKFLRMVVTAGVITLCILLVFEEYVPDTSAILSNIQTIANKPLKTFPSIVTSRLSFKSSSEDVPFKGSSENEPFNETLEVRERYCLRFRLKGYTFSDQGKVAALTDDMTTCLVHSFSPYIERQAMKSFLDPVRDNMFFANSPAILWHKGVLILVSRIWLDKEKWRQMEHRPSNEFMDNWFYTQKFDRTMQPLDQGQIIGMPMPKGGFIGDGPIEPRLFVMNDRVMVSFNVGMSFSQRTHVDYTILWDLEQHSHVVPRIRGGSAVLNATENGPIPCDKHWMALVRGGELHFVQLLDPLKVLNCSMEGACDVIHSDEDETKFVFNDVNSHLRGGTPFLEYTYPYYISVAHSTLFKEPKWKRLYGIHLVVLCVDPYRVVYVSEDIDLDNEIYTATNIVRSRYIEDNFIFPVGLIKETEDSLAVGVHANDHSSLILRIRGVEKLMQRVIAADKLRTGETGPPIGTLHEYIQHTMEYKTNYTFFHKSLKKDTAT